MLINILMLILGYIFGMFSLVIFCIFKQSSKISRYEELEEIKRQEFDKKYNLGKEFCKDKENNK
jgi:hypothetical protein